MARMDITLALIIAADLLVIAGAVLFFRRLPDVAPRTEAEQHDWTW